MGLQEVLCGSTFLTYVSLILRDITGHISKMHDKKKFRKRENASNFVMTQF